MHIFRSFPAMKKSVRLSGLHGWPHQIATAGRTQGIGPKGSEMGLLGRQWQTKTRICSVSAVAEVAVISATKTTILATQNLPLSYGLRRLSAPLPLHRSHVLCESLAMKSGLRISNSMAGLWLREDGQRHRMNARLARLGPAGTSSVSIRRHSFP